MLQTKNLTMIQIEAKVLQFSTVQRDEDRLTFLTSFATGGKFIVQTTTHKYELLIEKVVKEDGGGARFLFEATMVYAEEKNGTSKGSTRALYKGYFDANNKSGWIKAIRKSEWIFGS
jgi:hypothetical protein